MRPQPPPDSCPRCHGTRIVRLLWGYSAFTSQEAEAIAVGQAYLGLNRRYLTSADPTLVVGRFLAKRSRLPAWACLACFPEWSDVHRMARLEWEAESAKARAVEARDFEGAAALLHDQKQLEASHAMRYERLLRELVGQE